MRGIIYSEAEDTFIINNIDHMSYKKLGDAMFKISGHKRSRGSVSHRVFNLRFSGRISKIQRSLSLLEKGFIKKHYRDFSKRYLRKKLNEKFEKNRSFVMVCHEIEDLNILTEIKYTRAAKKPPSKRVVRPQIAIKGRELHMAMDRSIQWLAGKVKLSADDILDFMRHGVPPEHAKAIAEVLGMEREWL